MTFVPSPGSSLNLRGSRIRQLGDPCDAFDATNRQYVDSIACSMKSYQPLLTSETDLYLKSINTITGQIQTLTSDAITAQQINVSTLAANFIGVEEAIGAPQVSTHKLQLSSEDGSRYAIRADEQGVHFIRYNETGEAISAFSINLPNACNPLASLTFDTENEIYIGTVCHPKAIVIKPDGNIITNETQKQCPPPQSNNTETILGMWQFMTAVDQNLAALTDRVCALENTKSSN
jgi:hypothetical protein